MKHREVVYGLRVFKAPAVTLDLDPVEVPLWLVVAAGSAVFIASVVFPLPLAVLLILLLIVLA